MLPSAYGLGQYFQDLGHSFSPYGPTLSRQITYMYFKEIFSLGYSLGVKGLNKALQATNILDEVEPLLALVKFKS